MAGFTKDIKWHYAQTNNRCFVHDVLGDDTMGDGSQQRPWKTLTKAVTTPKSGGVF